MGILEFLDSIDASARKPRDIYAMPPRADAPRSPAPDPYAFGDLTSETARRAYEDMLALAGMGGQATRSMLPESVNQYLPDWLAQGGDYGLAGLTGLLGAAETGAGALGEGVEAFQRGMGMDGRYAPGGSAQALQSDLMGMLEGSGFAPEGRMVAGLADAAGPQARAGLLDMIPNEYGGAPIPYTRTGADIAARLASHPSARSLAGLSDVPHGGGFTEIGSKQSDLLAQHTSRGFLAPEVQAPEPVTIDKLLGRDLLSIVGDPTGRHTVTHLGDKKLINPVKSMAGFQYTDIGDQGYAGALGATSSKLNEALQSVDPYYISVLMGNQSGDFAQHTGDLIGEAFRMAQIDPKNVPFIDETLRNIGMSVKTKVTQPDGSTKLVGQTVKPFADFPGISDPAAVADYYVRLPTGTQRAAFTKGLDRAKLNQLGVPNIGDIRLALADPAQLGMDWGSTGYRGFTPDTARGTYPTTSGQSTTYDTGINKIGKSQSLTGEGMGIPANLVFRDSAAERRAKKTGGGLVMNSADYKVYESSPKAAKQRVDRQLVEIISNFREIEDRFGRSNAMNYAKQLLSGGQITDEMVKAARKANAPSWMIAAMTPAAGGLLATQPGSEPQ